MKSNSLTNKINNQITAPQLRVIDDADQNLGVLPLSEALRLAKEKGLDLVEIAAGANPPVAKIISYDKFRYQESKRLKKQQPKHKIGSKQIQISVREAKNDLMIKIRRLEEFLSQGHQIEIVMRLRGREKGNKDFARKKLEEFLSMIGYPFKITNHPSFGGYGLNMQISPQKK